LYVTNLQRDALDVGKVFTASSANMNPETEAIRKVREVDQDQIAFSVVVVLDPGPRLKVGIAAASASIGSTDNGAVPRSWCGGGRKGHDGLQVHVINERTDATFGHQVRFTKGETIEAARTFDQD
jgi:hypothetical protein